MRDFDLALGRHLPELLAAVQAERADDGERDEDGLLLDDRWDTYSVSGAALIHVFPEFLDRMAAAPDPDAIARFVAFLREWEELSAGFVLGDAMPLYLRWHVRQSPELMRLFPKDLSEGYAE